MADHFNAKDNSKRITYKNFLGKDLNTENTGKMQWGKKYKEKHKKIYKELKRILKPGGLFILNISDHIRKGEIMYVSAWHLKTLETLNFKFNQVIPIKTKRMKFGKNGNKRTKSEYIIVMENIK
jgi:hypothetical protein